MKRFYSLVVYFLLPIMVISSVMEVMLRNNPNRFKLQNEYLENYGNNIETLILGSSHTQFGIDPALLEDPAYNLSNVSQTLDLDYRLLQHFSHEMPNLNTIVIRLSYATMFEILEKSKESWRIKDYAIYFNLPTDNIFYESEILSVSLKQNFQRLITYYLQNETSVSTTQLGWGTETSSINGKDLELTGPRVAKKHSIENTDFLNDNQKTLNSLANWAEQRSIKLVVLSLPAYSTYVENLDSEQLKQMKIAGQKLQAQYSNVYYFNFMEDQRFTDEDFFDADHLNEIGARKFSLILNEILSH